MFKHCHCGNILKRVSYGLKLDSDRSIKLNLTFNEFKLSSESKGNMKCIVTKLQLQLHSYSYNTQSNGKSRKTVNERGKGDVYRAEKAMNAM